MSAKQSSDQSSAPRKQSDEMVQRIAKLTRMLRDSMRALGLDEAVKEAAEAIPDARERLRYVGRMTEQAANRVLTAAEQTQPLQAGLSTQAGELKALWQELPRQTRSQLPAEFTDRMEALLQNVEQDTAKTQAYLLEIIMAQDFQDLTGQVIQGMLEVITAMEKELIQVLLDSVPTEKREETLSLLNGPVVNPETDDVVRDQDEVDDLLSSLGF
ncbi:MAG TPA: protein phosphatase CheZ [Paenalcaligenes sp.]|nr:protein phosphatase CheZ [Paenalcaligenes sp.]